MYMLWIRSNSQHCITSQLQKMKALMNLWKSSPEGISCWKSDACNRKGRPQLLLRGKLANFVAWASQHWCNYVAVLQAYHNDYKLHPHFIHRVTANSDLNNVAGKSQYNLHSCFLHRVTANANLNTYHSMDDETVDAPTSMALHFINKKDADGLTPLQVALSSKNQCIKNAISLILSGADVHVK